MFQCIKVSIIIPVYNAEKYLDKCIRSCLNQTLKEIEIILIDDHSTDHSAAILKDYEQKHPEIIRTIFCLKNGRQGTARNMGIECAAGEYLAFVDADDWIEPDMCEVLYKAAEDNNADMAGANIFRDKNGNSELNCYKYRTTELGANNKEAVGKYSYYCGLFWSRIYRKDMIINNNIRFLEGVSYEDSYFNYLTALYANRVVKVENAFYHYYVSPSSTSRKRNDNTQYDKLYVIQKTFDECKQRGLYSEYKEEIEFKYFYMLERSIVPYMVLFDRPTPKVFREISSMVKNNTPKYYKSRYYRLLGKKKQILLCMVVFFPDIFPILGKLLFLI